MLRRFTCKLVSVDNIAKLSYIPCDALQGVLMEVIDTDYAEYLHTLSVNPYAQYVQVRKDGTFWTIQTLTEEAGKKIITPLLSTDFSKFHLKKLNKEIGITEKTQTEIALKDMVNKFYFEQSKRIFRINFLTPTAFKQDGKYIFYPDLSLIFGGLVRKHSAISQNKEENNTDTLEALVKNAEIVRYDLKSSYSEIGKTRIPAFCGMMVIKIKGPQSLVNYLNFLLRFGEYCGVGIKSSMGMGAIKITA